VSHWPTRKAKQVLAALLRIGWRVASSESSHKKLVGKGWADFTFSFHDGTEIGPKMMTRIAKRTGLEPDNL